MRSRWVFSVLALFAVLFANPAGAQAVPYTGPVSPPSTWQPSPEQLDKMPVVALPIQKFKLLSSGTGWASTGDRLLSTTDNGAHWKDISPPNPDHDSYADVFFTTPIPAGCCFRMTFRRAKTQLRNRQKIVRFSTSQPPPTEVQPGPKRVSRYGKASMGLAAEESSPLPIDSTAG